jgi:hypothetical protein
MCWNVPLSLACPPHYPNCGRGHVLYLQRCFERGVIIMNGLEGWNNIQKLEIWTKYVWNQPIPLATRPEAWFCSPSLAGIVGSNLAGAWMCVSCECCVLSGRGLCDGLINRPDEFYRVWSWSLDSEVDPDRIGAVVPLKEEQDVWNQHHKWGLRSSRILRGADWHLFTDFSGGNHPSQLHVSSSFGRRDRYVVPKRRLITTNLRHVKCQQKQRSHSHNGGSLKSRINSTGFKDISVFSQNIIWRCCE